MKPVHILQGILLAVALVEGNKTFYTKIKGLFVRLATKQFADYELIAYGGRSPLLPMPLFTLSDGIATTVYGDYVKVFGMYNDYYTIGPESKVKPLKIQLDKDSRVLNHRIDRCTCPSNKFDSLKVNDEICSENMECVPSDMYFLSTDEADKLNSRRVRNKRDTEPEAANQESGSIANNLGEYIFNLDGKNLDGKNLDGKNSSGKNSSGKNLGGNDFNLDGNNLDGKNGSEPVDEELSLFLVSRPGILGSPFVQ